MRSFSCKIEGENTFFRNHHSTESTLLSPGRIFTSYFRPRLFASADNPSAISSLLFSGTWP
jgi:hypothetical protein